MVDVAEPAPGARKFMRGISMYEDVFYTHTLHVRVVCMYVYVAAVSRIVDGLVA